MPDSSFDWVWNDPSHLEAHARDFLEDPATVLSRIEGDIAITMPGEKELELAVGRGEEVWIHRDLEMPADVGWSGLKNVCDDDVDSFWGFRIGRSIPSHLCLGAKTLTRWLCVWGRWEPGRFVIHTIYPGRRAPREIHDPSLPVAEIPAAITFWRCHAIVVAEGEYSLSPYPRVVPEG